MAACLILIGLGTAMLTQEAERDQAPRIMVDTGHPWRPPFGLDRVGRPLEAVVELRSRPAASARYVLANMSKGATIGAHTLRPPEQPPYAARVAIDDTADELSLLEITGPDRQSKEIARTAVVRPEIEADAVVRPDSVINPVDLGTILVPAGRLLLGPGQRGSLDAVALSRQRDWPNARLSTWFAARPQDRVSTALLLVRGKRCQAHLVLPETPRGIERDLVHVALLAGDGAELWHKTIAAMLVPAPPRLPAFGASAIKLRYDEPISVRDPRTGALSTLRYEAGWDGALEDVVVSLPNGARFVFWRGACYIPFWAGQFNTALCYEWAESLTRRSDAVDCVEPLMDKELRYGRVEIVESTVARVHVRWSYQSTDLLYHVWGDSAVEDYYFYPDGFGTRVVSLKSDPAADYELSEFIILTPQETYPLDVLPSKLIDVLFIDGTKQELTFPMEKKGEPAERNIPALYRVRFNRDEPLSAVYFNPAEKELPALIFGPFLDQGSVVTPAYWGSHWPLARGNATGNAIDDRIHYSPAHNSLMSWAARKPVPLHVSSIDTIDALGRSRAMLVRRWAWLIAMSNEPDDRLLTRARSYARPPELALDGARLDFDAYVPERRAIRLVVDRSRVSVRLQPTTPCVNPVFEFIDAPSGHVEIHLDGRLLDPERFAWDGHTLWLDATIDKPTGITFEFARSNHRNQGHP
jgi:hypothetical protein